MTFIPYNPQLKERAKKLRNQSTIAEILLWMRIKNKQLGVDFNRQKPLGNYIVDFYCNSLMLAIEIDGASHELKDRYDEKRLRELDHFGVTMLRYTNDQVQHNIDAVVIDITNSVKRLLQNTPSRLLSGHPS